MNLREYHELDKGVSYKAFGLSVGNRYFNYDIYWGDPEVLFDKEIIRMLPLATVAFPARRSNSCPRIYLHEKLTLEHKDAFEYVVMHEIGHLWLYEIIGVHHQLQRNDTEVWADYFAFNFFKKHRGVGSFDRFKDILNETLVLHGVIYGYPKEVFGSVFDRKAEDIRTLMESIETEQANGGVLGAQIERTIEPVLAALGDIFDTGMLGKDT